MILESLNRSTTMSETKPDIMDGCGVSFWVVAGLILLLAIPIGIRTCSDSGKEASVDELERIQRIRKIEDAAAEDRALGQQLTISLDEAMQRALDKFGATAQEEEEATQVVTPQADDKNVTVEESQK